MYTLTTVKSGSKFYSIFFDALVKIQHLDIISIVVDDNHTRCDELRSLCSEIGAVYVRGRIRGRSQALNYGLREIQCGRVVIWDIDDLLSDVYFQVIDRYNFQDNELVSLYPRVDINYLTKTSPDTCDFDFEDFPLSELFYRNVVSHTGLCFEVQAVVKQLGGYNSKIDICVDYDLLMRAYNNNFKLKRLRIDNCLFADNNPNSEFKYRTFWRYITAKLLIDMSNIKNLRDFLWSSLSLVKISSRPAGDFINKIKCYLRNKFTNAL